MNRTYLTSYIKKVHNIKTLIAFDDSDFLSIGYFNKSSTRTDISKEHYTLLYIIDGKGLFVDKYGTKHSLEPGALVLRKPGELHSIYRETKDWLEFFIIIPEYFYTFLKESGSIPKFDVSCLGIDSQWLNTLFNLTDKCLQLGKKNKHLVLPEILSFFLTVKEKQTNKSKYQTGQKEIL